MFSNETEAIHFWNAADYTLEILLYEMNKYFMKMNKYNGGDV